MQEIDLARELNGIKTIKMIQSRFNISKARAIFLVYKLRKKHYLKTRYKSNKERVYYISPEFALGGANHIDIINKYSPIKLAESEKHQIYGRELTVEEALIYAVKHRTIRYLTASLALFRKVKDWSSLYRLAKKEQLIRVIVSLYDVARLIVPKVKRMPKRFKNIASPKKSDKYLYIIDGFSSNDFKEIEDKWKVYIPFNTADLREYKGENR